MSRLKLLLMFPLVFSGKHVKLKEVKMMSGKNIEIRTTEPLQIHADGELLGQTPVEIQLEPVPLTIIL
ncbi:MAG: diacylglycerol kinase family lipid kinase, partial [Bacilli bacterium]